MQIDLSQISFKNLLLQENQIFVKDFANKISLLPSSAGTHLPTSIYRYMDANFFDWLCIDPNLNDNFA